MTRRFVLLSAIACLLAAAPAVGQRLIKTIPLPDSLGLPTYFCALVANPRDSVLYAGGDETDSILVFDEVLNRPVARFGIPGPVKALHYNPPLNRLYCAGSDGHVYVVDCATQSLIADVPGARRLYSITWDSLDNKLYFGADSSTLLAFDCNLNAVVGRIRGVSAYWPGDLCYVPSTGQVYVTGAGDSLVAVVDCASDSIVTLLHVGSYPLEVTYCSGVDRICLISGSGQDSLVVIDPSSGGAASKRVLPEGSEIAGFNPTTGHLYLFDEDDDGFFVTNLDGDSLVSHVPFGDSVGLIGAAVYSARDNLLYVSTNGNDDWSCDNVAGVVDGATDSVLALIPSPDYADVVVAGSLPGAFYFVCDEDLLLGFDVTRRGLRTCVARDFGITGLAASRPTGKVYCTGLAGYMEWSVMYAIDTAGWRVVAHAIGEGLGYSPEPIVVNGDGSKVYFIGWADNEVLVVDGVADTLLRRVVTNQWVGAMAFSLRNDKLYTAGCSSGVVGVIDGEGDSLLAEVPVEGFTDDVCVVGQGVKVYAFGRGSTVLAIDGMRDSVIAEFEVGDGLHRLCWDSRNNRLYVANADSANVKVFDCATDSFLGLLHTSHPVNSLCFDSARNRLYCTSSLGTLMAVDCATDTWKLLADDVGAVDDCPPYYDAVSNLLFYGNMTGIGVFDCELDSVVSRVECDEWLLPFVSAPGWDRVVVAQNWGSRLYVLESEPRNQASIHPSVPPPVHQQTLVSGSIFVQGAQRAELFSVSGTLVARLVPGYNDLSGVQPGVYFLNRGQGYITRKIVISR